MNKDARWIDRSFWMCLHHFLPSKMHMSEGMCNHLSCNVVRPQKTPQELMRDEPSKVIRYKPSKMVVKPLLTRAKCDWGQCTRNSGSRGYSRENSKYCDDACRRSKARKTYRMKKRGIK